MNFAQDIIELQTRLAFQEDHIQELNRVVADQDQEIRLLQHQVKDLVKRFDDYIYAQEQARTAPTDDRPPHY